MNRALLSVWDKTNIVDLAKFLVKNQVEIISTGGTKKTLEDNGIKVISVSDVTEFDEVMNGRVKTLHPKIFGGILADRNNKDHLNDLKKIKGKVIDLIVVNLYPFEEMALDDSIRLDQLIEYIDIGGPSMLRAAAKNYHSVLPLCDPEKYTDFDLN